MGSKGRDVWGQERKDEGRKKEMGYDCILHLARRYGVHDTRMGVLVCTKGLTLLGHVHMRFES